MARVVHNSHTDVFHQGDPPESVFFIEEGLVKYLRHVETGRDLMVGLYTPGWVLGAAAAILERPYGGRATAVTRCILWQTEAASFRELLREDPALSWEMLHMITRDLYDRVVQASDLNSVPARRRLENLLHTLVRLQNGNECANPLRIRLPLTREELAEAVGVTREHLFRLLKELRDDALVSLDKGWLVIQRPAALWHSSGDQ
jgi:CRP/FNR family transcriptional regulator, cyclic AMP receptor protein